MDAKLTPTTSLAAKRFATNETAILEVYGRNFKQTCFLTNLSLTGAFLELQDKRYVPRKKNLIKLSINLPQLNKEYLVYGEVVWVRGFGLGITFLKSRELYKLLSRRNRPY